VVISLTWIALSLVTELVTVALHCPGLPSRLVTELVTLLKAEGDRRLCRLACMQASFSFRTGSESIRIFPGRIDGTSLLIRHAQVEGDHRNSATRCYIIAMKALHGNDMATDAIMAKHNICY